MSEVINVDILQSIQDKFAESTGLSSVLVNREGIPVTKESRFTDFCHFIRTCRSGFQRCKMSDAQGGINALETGHPHIYQCPFGLTDIAAPIIVENRFIGTILCGQVLLEEDNYQESLMRIKEKTKNLDLDQKKLNKKMEKFEVIPESKIMAAAEFLSITANYIAEMGLVNIYQQELLEETRNRRELEQYLRTKELKILQSQVNPHFLFNVLNSIARLALIENAKETEEVAYALSDLLRYSLRNAGEMVKLQEEIDCIKDYLTIQKKRFGNNYEFILDFADDIKNINIPVLTIQPIVENAIIHGLKMQEKGKVSIKGYGKDDKVIIMVKDNGIGMSRNKIKKLLFYEEEEETNKSHVTGIGIHNVHKRLKYIFGEEYGLDIDSEPGKGMIVSIIIPKDNF